MMAVGGTPAAFHKDAGPFLIFTASSSSSSSNSCAPPIIPYQQPTMNGVIQQAPPLVVEDEEEFLLLQEENEDDDKQLTDEDIGVVVNANEDGALPVVVPPELLSICRTLYLAAADNNAKRLLFTMSIGLNSRPDDDGAIRILADALSFEPYASSNQKNSFKPQRKDMIDEVIRRFDVFEIKKGNKEWFANVVGDSI